MSNFLKAPYMESGDKKSKFLSMLLSGLFVFLFLFLFKPFGIESAGWAEGLLVCLGYGLITAFVLLVFKFAVEPACHRRNWVLWKEILWDILIAVVIGIFNFFYSVIVFLQRISLAYFLYFIWTTILVGVILVSVHLILYFNRMYREALIAADLPTEPPVWEPEVILTAGSVNNCFRINPRNIVYICANDNYITVVWLCNGQQQKTTLRGTLKAVEKELAKNNRFVRCHKSYMVNLDHADSLSGNSQNLRIKVRNSSADIPVSRMKAGIVQACFSRQ